MKIFDRLFFTSVIVYSSHNIGRTAYITSHTIKGMTTRIKRLRKKVLVSVFKGTNKYAEAIRNSGTAGRTNPLIKHTLQRPASEGNEKNNHSNRYTLMHVLSIPLSKQ